MKQAVQVSWSEFRRVTVGFVLGKLCSESGRVGLKHVFTKLRSGSDSKSSQDLKELWGYRFRLGSNVQVRFKLKFPNRNLEQVS